MNPELQKELEELCKMIDHKYSIIQSRYFTSDAPAEAIQMLNPSVIRPLFGFAINVDYLKPEYK